MSFLIVPLIHGIAQNRMLHVTVYPVKLNRLPVKVEYLVADFSLLKSYPPPDNLQNRSGRR
jgi:hypothetical protein